MFAHYAKWIPNFSTKIRPLVDTKVFPITKLAEKCFSDIRQDIAKSVVSDIDPSVPFTVGTDASEFAIGATLSQCERAVAFFSRTLSNYELNHTSVEKEAYAIVESLKKWRHFLLGRHFVLITDQRSVSFMFDRKK